MRGRDGLDVSLHDEVLAREVELTAALMIAASESVEGRLCPREVDRLLGL